MKKTWPRLEVKAVGAVVAALGATVLVGWATHSRSLIVIYPPTAMQRNTALGLLICGLGMIGLAGRRKLPALLSGAFCALLGLLTAIEYALGLNLRIDELLGSGHFGGEVSPPGRMSPIATVCFMLAGSAVFFARSNVGPRFRSWVLGIVGPVLAAIGAVAGMGYIFGNTHAFGWSHLTRIAFSTALGFLLIGISLLMFAWGEEGEPETASAAPGSRRAREWLPLSAGIAVLTATLGIWQALMARGLEKQPLLPEIALASGVVLALLLALLVYRMERGKRSPESTLLAGFGFALATLIAVGVVQYRNIHLLVETDSWVERTQTVLMELEETVGAVRSMESDVRGYVATGNEDFVKKSGIWSTMAAGHIQALRKLTADNPRQRRSLDQFEPLIQQKIDFMRRLGLLRREHGQAAANSMIAQGEGIGLTEEILSLGERMKAEENGLLADRKARSKASARKVNVVITLGTLMALAFVLGAAHITRRDSAQRRQAEEHLRKSEEKYRTLFDSIDEGFCTIEVLFDGNQKPVDYRFLEINPSFEKQTGIQNARGRRMRKIAPLHEEYWFEIYGKIALTGEPARFENPAAQLHRWYDVYAFRVGEPQQKRVAILFNDITQRKQAEAALKESEAAFRALSESVPQMVWMCTPDGLNIYFNQRWVDYTGLTLEESYGRGWNTPFHPDDRQAAWDAWNQATSTGNRYQIESRLRAADGSYRWFLMRGEPLRDAAGRITKWFGTCTDIDDLKRATEGLRQANAYNRSLLEASLDPLVTITPDGKITDVNQATEQVTGLTRQATRRHRFLRLLH